MREEKKMGNEFFILLLLFGGIDSTALRCDLIFHCLSNEFVCIIDA